MADTEHSTDSVALATLTQMTPRQRAHFLKFDGPDRAEWFRMPHWFYRSGGRTMNLSRTLKCKKLGLLQQELRGGAPAYRVTPLGEQVRALLLSQSTIATLSPGAAA